MLRSLNNSASAVHFLNYSSGDDDTVALLVLFNEILAEAGEGEMPSVFILGRYGFDVKRIKNQDIVFFKLTSRRVLSGMLHKQ